MSKIIAIGLGAVVLIAVLVLCLVPIKQVSYTVTESYQTTETYYTSEPYTGIETYYEKEPFLTYETYTEKEPYEDSVPIDYVVIKQEGYNYFGGVGCDVAVYIQNADVVSGTFTVLFTLSLLGSTGTTVSESKYIAAGYTERVITSYKSASLKTPSSFTYSITAPTKTVTAYRDVEKIREVTDYRDVEKTREVTKYRDVAEQRTVWKERPVTRYKNVSMLEYLISY